MLRRVAPSAGASLVEALVALLVLSLGLLGLGRLMASQMADSRSASARGIALQHLDALRESIAVNPSARYALDWRELRVAAVDCSAAACTPDEVADHDLVAWRNSLSLALPGADATVYPVPSDPRQLAIVVAWPVADGADPEIAAGDVACPLRFACHAVRFRR